MIIELISFAIAPVNETEIRKDAPVCPVTRQCTPRKPIEKEKLESFSGFLVANSSKSDPKKEPVPYRGGRNDRERQPNNSK